MPGTAEGGPPMRPALDDAEQVCADPCVSDEGTPYAGQAIGAAGAPSVLAPYATGALAPWRVPG